MQLYVTFYAVEKFQHFRKSLTAAEFKLVRTGDGAVLLRSEYLQRDIEKKKFF